MPRVINEQELMRETIAQCEFERKLCRFLRKHPEIQTEELNDLLDSLNNYVSLVRDRIDNEIRAMYED